MRAAQARKGLKGRNRNRRHNAAFIRQGEWFFIPEPGLVVDKRLVLRHEPLARGRGKPHWAEFLYRTGGETVYVSRDYPQGLTEPEYKALLARKPSASASTGRPCVGTPACGSRAQFVTRTIRP